MESLFVLCIIGLIFCVIGFILGLDDEVNCYIGLIGCGITIILSLIIIGIEENKPTALDVYQGKTTLEITYKDSIPVDSVVVFK